MGYVGLQNVQVSVSHNCKCYVGSFWATPKKTRNKSKTTRGVPFIRFFQLLTTKKEKACERKLKKKEKMMNVLALCLVITSLATAGVLSPKPEKGTGDEVITKEGHRIIVVEYEKEGIGNTKVSISPQDETASYKTVGLDAKHPATEVEGAKKELLSEAASSTGGVVENAKEKIKDASSALPNLGQGLSGPPSNGHGPRELICDAFGKCKHKIASAFGKAREEAKEAAETAGDKISKAKEGAEEAVGDAFGKAKDEVNEAVETAGDALGKAKDTVAQKAHEIGKAASGTLGKAKDTAHTIVDTSKTIQEDVSTNFSEKIDQPMVGIAKEGKEMAETLADKLKAGAEKLKEEPENVNLTQILQRGLDVWYDAMKYLLSSVGAFMGLIHLLGFATAYGMCVWVTFVSSYVLARALPTQQLGVVQSKIYPVYFKAMAYGIGAALLGHLLNQRKNLFSSKSEMLQGYNLVGSLLMVLANLMYLEPRATKVMFERMKLEKEEGRGKDGYIVESRTVTEPSTGGASGTVTTTASAHTPTTPDRAEKEMLHSRSVRLLERLKKLNSYSSLLNILTLMALTWHLVYLGQRLNVAS